MLLPIESVRSLKQVDTAIFTLRYFGRCMQCTYCQDGCCQHGCDVNLAERDRILALQEELRPYIRTAPEQWFSQEVQVDSEYETGKFVRTLTVGGGCAFLNPNGRGCGIHAFALAQGRDYHSLKPAVCWLFPVTWDQEVLRPSWDVTEDLVCRSTGPSLYEVCRAELGHFFGAALLTELDALRPRVAPPQSPMAKR